VTLEARLKVELDPKSPLHIGVKGTAIQARVTQTAGGTLLDLHCSGEWRSFALSGLTVRDAQCGPSGRLLRLDATKPRTGNRRGAAAWVAVLYVQPRRDGRSLHRLIKRKCLQSLHEQFRLMRDLCLEKFNSRPVAPTIFRNERANPVDGRLLNRIITISD